MFPDKHVLFQNILYTLDSYYCYRLTILFGNWLYPFYDLLPNWMLRLSFFLTYSTILADFLATFLILANRWTAITMAMNYKWVTKIFTENLEKSISQYQNFSQKFLDLVSRLTKYKSSVNIV
ncbi:unnamed protein product [Meloidogyne enterolobii]|uniref:Uncharacterized protein n=1 Tax=Meloidogyne enterolobii TaxID=390850 RepID=A0ACB0YPW0_MELEN